MDGSGRQLLLVTDGEKVLVRAGGFLGSPKEFCAKVKKEGKPVYVAAVKAVARVLLDTVNQTKKEDLGDDVQKE